MPRPPSSLQCLPLVISLFLLFSLSSRFVTSITVEIRINNVAIFSAPAAVELGAPIIAIQESLHYSIVPNISTLVDIVHDMAEAVNISSTIECALDMSDTIGQNLENLTCGLTSALTTMDSEIDLLNAKVVDSFMPDVSSFTSSLDSNLSALNSTLVGVFSSFDVSILTDQVMNTCILAAVLILLWVYFSMFWPSGEKMEQFTVEFILTSFGIPAIPLLIGTVGVEIVWFVVLAVEWEALKGVFFRNLVIVFPFVLVLFSGLQAAILAAWCLYIRVCMKKNRK